LNVLGMRMNVIRGYNGYRVVENVYLMFFAN
jgi:hypothetical protein